ncbi:MAG: class II aldolase/adducin family protein [Armatimonadota bacterium]
MNRDEVLHQLIELSHWLGSEERGLSILGEGNTSARLSDRTFLVKASGSCLGTLSECDAVEVRFDRALAMLDGDFSEERMRAAMVAPGEKLPSVETLFHAYLLSLPGVNFVGHTHPVSVNCILCAKNWREATSGRIFPAECSGAAPPVHVETSAPGPELARRMRSALEAYMQELGRPQVVLLQNHGIVALGGTPDEVRRITAAWDKIAKVLAGTYHFGGPNYLQEEVE